MGLAGNIREDKTIWCSRVHPALTGEKLAEFITERLQNQEKVQAVRQVLNGDPKEKDIHVIQDQKGHKGSKGKGNSKGKSQGNVSHRPPSNPVTPPSDWDASSLRDDFPSPRGSASSILNSRPYQGKGYQDRQPDRTKTPSPQKEKPNCHFCHVMGRSEAHTPENCPQLEFLKEIKKNTCLHCKDLNLPSQHPYKTCELRLQRSGKGGKKGKYQAPKPQANS